MLSNVQRMHASTAVRNEGSRKGNWRNWGGAL